MAYMKQVKPRSVQSKALTNKVGRTGIFSVYLRGRLWAPVPMQNTLIFSQFDKKNSQSENEFQ